MHSPVFRPPDATLLDRLVPWLYDAKLRLSEKAHEEQIILAQTKHAQDVQNWERFCASAESKHQRVCEAHHAALMRSDSKVKQAEADNAKKMRDWEKSFIDARARHQRECEAYRERVCQLRDASQRALDEHQKKVAQAEAEWRTRIDIHRKAVEDENAERRASYKQSVAADDAKHREALACS